MRDGPVWTSAGVTAGIDLALALVEEDLGRDVTLACNTNTLPCGVPQAAGRPGAVRYGAVAAGGRTGSGRSRDERVQLQQTLSGGDGADPGPGLIAKSFVPARPLRELRELLRYRRNRAPPIPPAAAPGTQPTLTVICGGLPDVLHATAALCARAR